MVSFSEIVELFSRSSVTTIVFSPLTKFIVAEKVPSGLACNIMSSDSETMAMLDSGSDLPTSERVLSVVTVWFDGVTTFSDFSIMVGLGAVFVSDFSADSEMITDLLAKLIP